MCGKFWRFVDIADCIICSSSFIAKFGRELGCNTNCLEDSINYDHFTYRRQENSKTPVKLVWSGVSVKAEVLNFLADTINANDWDFIVLSDKKPALDFPYQFIQWKYNNFPKDIVKGNVAVFPRKVDNEYDKGHSFFKIGVFLAEHVPVVCSPVPSYKQVIRSNNGCFVKTLNCEDWHNAITDVSQKNDEINFYDNPICDFSTLKLASRYEAFFQSLIC